MLGGNAATDFLKSHKNHLLFGLSVCLVLFSLIVLFRADSVPTWALFANTVFTLIAGSVLFATVALDWKETNVVRTI